MMNHTLSVVSVVVSSHSIVALSGVCWLCSYDVMTVKDLQYACNMKLVGLRTGHNLLKNKHFH